MGEDGREKIMRMFFREPYLEIHLSEIARRAKISKERASVYLKELVGADFLTRKKVGRMLLFKPNLGNELLRKKFETYELQKKRDFYAKEIKIGGLCRSFVEGLQDELGDKLSMVFLFGSSARKERKKKSDVDLLVVVLDNKDNCDRVVSKLGRSFSLRYNLDVVPLTETIGEFREGLRMKARFYDNLWEDRITLFGETNFFREVSGVGVYSGEN